MIPSRLPNSEACCGRFNLQRGLSSVNAATRQNPDPQLANRMVSTHFTFDMCDGAKNTVREGYG